MGLDDVKEAQGWSDSTLVIVLTDFLHSHNLYTQAVGYAQLVAREENHGL